MVLSSTLTRVVDLIKSEDFESARELLAGSVLGSDLSIEDNVQANLLYAEALSGLGKFEEVVSVLGELLYQIELDHGSESPYLIDPVIALAKAEEKLLNFMSAEKLYAETFELLLKTGVSASKRAEVAYLRASLCLNHLADPSRALIYFKQATSIWERSKNTISLEYCIAQFQIGTIEANLRNWEKARNSLDKAMECIVAGCSDETALIFQIVRQFVQVCREQKDANAEERAFRVLTEQIEKLLGPSVEICQALGLKAAAQLRSESFIAAKRTLEQIKELFSQVDVLGEQALELLDAEYQLRVSDYTHCVVDEAEDNAITEIPGMTVSANRRRDSKVEAYALLSGIALILLEHGNTEHALALLQQQLSFLTIHESEDTYIFERLHKAFDKLERYDDASWALDMQHEFEELAVANH